MTQPPLPGRLILLPELGLDSKIFEQQARVFGRALVQPNWINPRENETIHDYALRWAETFKPLPDDQTPLLLGGLSIGGIFALEMSKLLKPQAVILIASCRSPADLPYRLTIFEKILRPIPPTLAELLTGPITSTFAFKDRLDDVNTQLVKKVARNCSMPLIKWGLQQIVQWKGFDQTETEIKVPIYQIHGKNDWMLPLNQRQPIDHVIHNGRHLINLTHPATVNRFILGLMKKHCATSDPDSN